MVNLILVTGQHRNEKGAVYLGPFVAKRLEKLSHEVILIENPEKRTLLEIVIQAEQNHERLSKRQVEKLLEGWHGKALSQYPENYYSFNLHNSAENSDSAEEDAEYRRAFYFFSDLRGLKGINKNLGRLISFANPWKRRFTIEIPGIDESGPPDYKLVKRVLSPKTIKYYGKYLSSTDLTLSRENGFLGEEIIDTLTKGIAYLVRMREKGVRYGLYHKRYKQKL